VELIGTFGLFLIICWIGREWNKRTKRIEKLENDLEENKAHSENRLNEVFEEIKSNIKFDSN